MLRLENTSADNIPRGSSGPICYLRNFSLPREAAIMRVDGIFGAGTGQHGICIFLAGTNHHGNSNGDFERQPATTVLLYCLYRKRRQRELPCEIWSGETSCYKYYMKIIKQQFVHSMAAVVVFPSMACAFKSGATIHAKHYQEVRRGALRPSRNYC